MRQYLRRALERSLVDTHLWVAAAAASLALFASAAMGLPLQLPPIGVVFSATLLIYAVDDVFDGRMRLQPARWLTVGLGAVLLSAQLVSAPAPAVLAVLVGTLPALLYGAPIRGRRFRELPGVKPFFVATSLAVAAVGVPALWTWSTTPPPLAAPRVIATTGVLFLLILSNVCFFDLRDRLTDVRDGVRTIPVWIGVAGTRRFCLALSLAAGLVATARGGDLRAPLLVAAAATAAYALFLPTPGGRLQYALVVDGVPVLLGVAILLY